MEEDTYVAELPHEHVNVGKKVEVLCAKGGVPLPVQQSV